MEEHATVIILLYYPGYITYTNFLTTIVIAQWLGSTIDNITRKYVTEISIIIIIIQP